MALNMTVTSKFDPFTQEDYIKPLANYWKEYEKYEDALLAEEVKLKTLESNLMYLTDKDSELKKQYEEYKNALESASNDMMRGLSYATKNNIRKNILPMYITHIQPLQEGIQKKAKAVEEYMKLREDPNNLMSSVNPMDMPVSSFIGINAGDSGYFHMRGDNAGKEVASQASTYTSSRTSSDTITENGKQITTKITGSQIPTDIEYSIDGDINISGGAEADMDKIRQFWDQYKKTTNFYQLSQESREKAIQIFDKNLRSGWLYAKTTDATKPQSSWMPLGHTAQIYNNNGEKIPVSVFTNASTGELRYVDLNTGIKYSAQQANNNEEKAKQKVQAAEQAAQYFTEDNKPNSTDLEKLNTYQYSATYDDGDIVWNGKKYDDNLESILAGIIARASSLSSDWDKRNGIGFLGDDVPSIPVEQFVVASTAEPADLRHGTNTYPEPSIVFAYGADEDELPIKSYPESHVYKLLNYSYLSQLNSGQSNLSAETFAKIIIAIAAQKSGESQNKIPSSEDIQAVFQKVKAVGETYRNYSQSDIRTTSKNKYIDEMMDKLQTAVNDLTGNSNASNANTEIVDTGNVDPDSIP